MLQQYPNNVTRTMLVVHTMYHKEMQIDPNILMRQPDD